jgi:phosphomannomutase
VGHDARHGSQQFAEDAARVLAAAGLQALHFESALPTPVLAFAVRHFAAVAGVMVTASHNPAPDNGYKVYLADGAQIFPPHDARVAAAAEKAILPPVDALPGQRGDSVVAVDEAEVLAAYRRSAIALLEPSGPRRLRSVYSPLHGVGGAVLPGLMEEAGFEPPQPVDAQASPDPDFPTTPFPNPEEPGVMDLALARAESAKADVVLVNDPDADRLAVALPGARGGFRVLTGDELGVLIAAHLLARTSGSDRLVAATVVSSTMLSDMAHQAGVEYVETLTGFKWLARAARLRPGHRLIFAYEEALGYAASEAVADKDGMSAALVVAEMAALAKEEGRSLLERLDGLEADLGVHSSAQWSWRLEGSAAGGVIRGLMARWRSSPPERLGSCAVASVRDLVSGEAELPPSDVLVLELANGGRVVLRPSGTEPKLKVYFEATTGPCDQGGLAEARRWARRQLGEMRTAVLALVTSYQGALS